MILKEKGDRLFCPKKEAYPLFFLEKTRGGYSILKKESSSPVLNFASVNVIVTASSPS